MKKFEQANKTTATVLAGAVVALVINFYPQMFDANAQAGLQTLLSALLVYFIPNRG